jgi:Glycosyltransferase family 9 (heptosyltransferase)
MKLIERYALSTGLKINKPYIYKAFYPLPFEKYITVHASSGMKAKMYSFWEDVIELIKPTLDKLNIAIVQLGGPDDEQLKHCNHLQGRLNIQQSAYVISNSMLHLSNDTFSAHVAGAMDIPLVTLFGSTTVDNHAPYFYDPKVSTFLEADRKGFRPSFASEEMPKMVDTILPETIANAALTHFDSHVKRSSLYFGEYYPTYIVEYIPDHVIAPNYLANGVINIRMDYHFNEDNFVKVIYNRKCNVIADRQINIKLIRGLKKHINRLSFQVNEETSPEYVKQLKATGIDLHLFTHETDEEKLKELRLKHFEYEIVQEKLTTKESLDFKDKIGYNTCYKTNKFILAKDGIFLSKADWLTKKAVKSFDDNIREIPDVPEFWAEVDYFYIFNKE